MDLVPLVEHPHHNVHKQAVAVLVELARGLRGHFMDLCDGVNVMSLAVRKMREKKLRPAASFSHIAWSSSVPLAKEWSMAWAITSKAF